MSDVFDAVIDDLEGRNLIGWAQNRKPLLANEPGRDWLREAYEEALDMSVYLKAELMMREARVASRVPPPAPSNPIPRDLDLGFEAWRPRWGVIVGIVLLLIGVGGVAWPWW